MKFIKNAFLLAGSFIISIFLVWFISAYFPLILIVAMVVYCCFKLKRTAPAISKNSGIHIWISKNRDNLKNMMLAVVTFSVCLLAWEHYLRTDITLQSQLEKNNSGEFQSPYDDPHKEGCHVYEPYQSYDDHAKEFVHYIRANELGLNDRHYALKTDSAIRIAALGDSFTEGIGSVGDSSYPKILQTILPGAEVMGCGISGSDPIFEYELLKRKLLAYKPDIVTIAINQSDISDAIVRGGFERFLPDGTYKCRKGPFWESLFANWYIVRFMVIKVFGMDFLFLTPQKRFTEEEKAIDILKSGIDSIQALCIHNNIRCIFIFHPIRAEIGKGKMACDPVMQYANARGYETINILKYFMENGANGNNSGQYFWPLDGHNNNKGYLLFAKAIKDDIALHPKLQPAKTHQVNL